MRIPRLLSLTLVSSRCIYAFLDGVRRVQTFGKTAFSHFSCRSFGRCSRVSASVSSANKEIDLLADSLKNVFKTSNPMETSGVPETLRVRVVDTMPEPLPLDLGNKYYLLRHGESQANVESIISSHRSLALSNKHGVTTKGYEQGKESARQLVDILRNTTKAGDEVILVSSPFARARQTAQACLDGLSDMEEEMEKELGVRVSTDIVFNNGLVERYFGRLDGEAIYTYAYVWPLDKINVTHTAFGVESVAAVSTRIRDTILQLEKTYQNKHLVLVSHADTLQIAKLYAAQAENVGEFSSYRFRNGEVRQLISGSTSHFPDPAPLDGPKRCTQNKLKQLKVNWFSEQTSTQ